MGEKTAPDTADLSNKNMWPTGNDLPAMREASFCLKSLEGSCVPPGLNGANQESHSPTIGYASCWTRVTSQS